MILHMLNSLYKLQNMHELFMHPLLLANAVPYRAHNAFLSMQRVSNYLQVLDI